MDVHDIVQEAVIKATPKKKKCKNVKWFSEETLQIAVQDGEHMYTRGWFMSMYGKNHHNTVK